MEVEDEGIPSTALREISLLRELEHPNIVRLLDCIQNEGRLYLVFEFVDKDLKKYMDHVTGDIDPKLVQVSYIKKSIQNIQHDFQAYVYQLVRGLYVSHSRGIMHR